MKKDMGKATHERVITGSGNVFADLKLPDAAELDTKLKLGATICNIAKRRRLSQADIAELLGINQPKVSALLHFKLEGFSVERLIRFLVSLDQDVETVIKHKPRNRRARAAVIAARRGKVWRRVAACWQSWSNEDFARIVLTTGNEVEGAW